MKKLLIMASLFWPQKNSGGPPVSIMNLVKSIEGRFETYIVSKNHELGDDKPLPGIQVGWNTFSFGKAYYVPHGQHSFNNIMKLIDQVQPDVIYQNSFFSYDDLFPVLIYKRKNQNVKVIVAPRGEFYPERLQKGKLKKMVYSSLLRLSGLLRDVHFQGTGQEECNQCAKLLGTPESHLLDIQNLSVVGIPAQEVIEKSPGTIRLVYIARVHPTKNILNAIRWLDSVRGNVAFDIFGPIEGEEYWQQCQSAIAALPNNIRVDYKGMVAHDQVTDVISGYHGYYMPTTGENFGHSIVESLLVGRPVVISDQTPWTDVQGVGGYAFPLNQPEQFSAAIEELCAMGQAEFDALCEGAKVYIRKKLNTEETVAQYIRAFDGEKNDKKSLPTAVQ